MCRILVVIFVVFLIVAQVSEAAVTSYHIGNSLTWDSQPLALAQFSAQRGITADSEYHIDCNKSLPYIWDHPTSSCVTPVASYGLYANTLPNHDWNAVTLQPFPGSNITLGDDTTAMIDFINLARSNPANANTKFYIYAAWPTKGDYQTKWTKSVVDADNTLSVINREYVDHLINRVRAAALGDVFVIPVGEVLYELDVRMQEGQILGYTSIDQFYRDAVHLSYGIGRYTAGITTFATLFGENPLGLTKPSGFFGSSTFSPALASAVQSTVWDVVSSYQYSEVPEPSTAACLLTVLLLLKYKRS